MKMLRYGKKDGTSTVEDARSSAVQIVNKSTYKGVPAAKASTTQETEGESPAKKKRGSLFRGMARTIDLLHHDGK